MYSLEIVYKILDHKMTRLTDQNKVFQEINFLKLVLYVEMLPLK